MKKEKAIMWVKAAGMRAIKTFSQTALAIIGTSYLVGDVDWVMVGSASLMSFVLSMLTSIAGLPELEQENQNGIDT